MPSVCTRRIPRSTSNPPDPHTPAACRLLIQTRTAPSQGHGPRMHLPLPPPSSVCSCSTFSLMQGFLALPDRAANHPLLMHVAPCQQRTTSVPGSHTARCVCPRLPPGLRQVQTTSSVLCRDRGWASTLSVPLFRRAPPPCSTEQTERYVQNMRLAVFLLCGDLDVLPLPGVEAGPACGLQGPTGSALLRGHFRRAHRLAWVPRGS